MRDLRPYVCTAPDCEHAEDTFPSLIRYLNHEIKVHESGMMLLSARLLRKKREKEIFCIFCQEWTEVGSGENARGRHIGRHMEEIAFAVVPKAYEDWEFYSESSTFSAQPSEPKPDIDEPILLLGSVFDADALGKCIYEWAILRHDENEALPDMASDLCLQLVIFALGSKKAFKYLPRVRSEAEDDAMMYEDFVESGNRLWARLTAHLTVCEASMLKTAEKVEGTEESMDIPLERGMAFIDCFFGQELRNTERLLQSIRLWNTEYEVICEGTLRRLSTA